MAKIHRLVGDKNIFELPNSFIGDKKLSLKSKGMLSFLLTYSKEETIYLTDLPFMLSEGQAAIKSALDELENHGYLTRERGRQDSKGRFTHQNITVYPTSRTKGSF